MRRSLAIALLVLGATVGVWAQNTDAASDKIVVVGNRAQPVQWNHRESIQDAINAAKPNGTVIIPSSYGGTDCNPVSNCNPGSVTVQDWRTNGGGSGVNCGGINAIVFQSAIGQLAICDPNATLDGNGNLGIGSINASGNITAQGNVAGNRLSTSGSGGILDLQFQTAPVLSDIALNHAFTYADTTTGLLGCLKNIANTLLPCFTSVQLLGSGPVAMPTAAITSPGCSSAVTLTATGATTSSRIVATPNVDPTGVTGYGPSTGSLFIVAWVTSNTANFKVCNPPGGITTTPGALTLNAVVF
jgi:hypothetical protein